MAGVTANMQWDATALSALLRKIPGTPSTTRSRIAVQGEFAMSKPQPNAAGQAYVESFEGEAERQLPMSEAAWYYGSRPALGTTLASVGSSVFSVNRATTLAFQNNGVDVAGNFVQFNIQQSIRRYASWAGGVLPSEQLLWMTLYPLKTAASSTSRRVPTCDGLRGPWVTTACSAPPPVAVAGDPCAQC